jgi:hypothetical protein
VATTLREVHSTNRHSWGAVAWIDGKTYVSPTCELDVVDRVGGGDGFAAGLIFGMLSGDVTQERFDRLRYVEIKHGRIAQLAFLGQIVTRAGIHLPGNIDYAGDSFDSYPNGIAALIGPNSIPFEGQGQIIAFIGLLEVSFMRDVPGTGNKHVGNFRNGYIDFGWDDFDEETKLSKRAIELNNGRAAMFGILGLMVHEEIIPLGYDPDLPIIGHLV